MRVWLLIPGPPRGFLRWAAICGALLVLPAVLGGCLVVLGSPETDICGRCKHREMELTFINNTSGDLIVTLEGPGDIDPPVGRTAHAHGGRAEIEAEIFDRDLPATYTWRAGAYCGIIVLPRGQDVRRTVSIPHDALTPAAQVTQRIGYGTDCPGRPPCWDLGPPCCPPAGEPVPKISDFGLRISD